MLRKLQSTPRDVSDFQPCYPEENPHVVQSVFPCLLLLPEQDLGHGQEARLGSPWCSGPRAAQAPATKTQGPPLLAFLVLTPSFKCLTLRRFCRDPGETCGIPAGWEKGEVPPCHTAFLLNYLGASRSPHRRTTLSAVSDVSTPTHPGWTSGGGIHGVPSWRSHAAANPRPAFSEFLDFLIFAPSFNFFPEFRKSAWCSLWFLACSLANLRAVVWGPRKSSPNYITAWLFKIKESCWHTKI